ncbi:hypothetical protein HW555_006164 [Spodoptera exigua]|uniref:Uncharacterized protein n=1 Tax=Spodoptera exigua TaxID=7107 RepID=A0A835LAB9_SPOEX|nr:hypothetical protein HW555_006164 [Spodoptera exigua]
MILFWKPYTPDQEQALDLSRPVVRTERVSPLPARSAPSSLVPVPEVYPGFIGYLDAVSVYYIASTRHTNQHHTQRRRFPQYLVSKRPFAVCNER